MRFQRRNDTLCFASDPKPISDVANAVCEGFASHMLAKRALNECTGRGISEEKDMEAELRHVLEATFPGEAARYFLPMSIGSTPETADEGAVLILNGTKTLTSSPFWDYPDGKIPLRRRACCAVGRFAEAAWHCRDDAGRDHALWGDHRKDGSRLWRGGADGRMVASGDGGVLQGPRRRVTTRSSPTTPRTSGNGSRWSIASDAGMAVCRITDAPQRK